MDVDVAECVVCLRHCGKELESETQDCLFLALVALTKSQWTCKSVVLYWGLWSHKVEFRLELCTVFLCRSELTFKHNFSSQCAPKAGFLWRHSCFILQSKFISEVCSELPSKNSCRSSLCYPDLQRVPLILVYLCDFQRGKCCSYLQACCGFTVAARQISISSHFRMMLSSQETGAVYAARMLVTGDGFPCAYICVHLNDR